MLEQAIADGGLLEVNRRGAVVLVLFAESRHRFVLFGFDYANLALAAFVPFVGDDAVLVGRTTSGHRGVPGGRQGVGVGIVAVLVPGAVPEQTAEAVLVVQFLPARRIVAAHLVKNDHNDELGLFGANLVRRLGGRIGKRQKRHDAGDGQRGGEKTRTAGIKTHFSTTPSERRTAGGLWAMLTRAGGRDK